MTSSGQQPWRTPEQAAQARREERAKRRRRRIALLAAAACSLVLLCSLGAWGIWSLIARSRIDPGSIAIPSWIDQELIDLDGDARDGTPINKVRDIAIHYVGNPDTTAMANRNYFNQPGVEVSSHFIVGLEGEIIQCVPLGEKSAATNQRNSDTISIEVCHPDETGKFNDQTYASLIQLCAWLCHELNLDEDNLIRHYDVTGKLCPLYYVEHEDAWRQLKEDVGRQLGEME
jgi:hypothetical protein